MTKDYKKISGVLLIIILIVSLGSYFYIKDLKSENQKMKQENEKYKISLTDTEKEKVELNTYVQKKKQTDKNFETSKNEKIIQKFLMGLYSYTPENKDKRFDDIKDIMYDSVYAKLNPEQTNKEDETVVLRGDISNYEDQNLTVNIRDIKIYSNNQDDYLAEFVLVMDAVNNRETVQKMIAKIQMNKNKVFEFEPLPTL